jgi:hypothetical protein
VVADRTFAWLNQFRGLRVRHDGQTNIHEGLFSLDCVRNCWQSLRKTWKTPAALSRFLKRQRADNLVDNGGNWTHGLDLPRRHGHVSLESGSDYSFFSP